MRGDADRMRWPFALSRTNSLPSEFGRMRPFLNLRGSGEGNMINKQASSISNSPLIETELSLQVSRADPRSRHVNTLRSTEQFRGNGKQVRKYVWTRPHTTAQSCIGGFPREKVVGSLANLG